MLENLEWIFSGIGNVILNKAFNPSKDKLQINQQPNLITKPLEAEEKEEEPYAVSLGKRHRFLREHYLQLNPRKMADFYEYDELQNWKNMRKVKKSFLKNL